MNTITHTQILNRLNESFTDVSSTLVEFDSNILKKAEFQHTVTVLSIGGSEFSIGVYSNDFESEIFTRFIYSLNTKQAFIF